MREVGVVRFQYFGDQAAAQARVSQARTELGKLKNLMQLGGLDQLSRTTKLADGTIIVCTSRFGEDEILITTPRQVVEPAERVLTFDVSASALFGYLIPTGAAQECDPVALNVAIAGHLYSFGVRGLELVVLGEQDENQTRIGYCARAASAGDYDRAAAVLNSIEQAGGDNLDIALACDEGFFVDPAIVAGKAYEESLLASMEPYLATFAHVAIPADETYDLPAEYNRLYHGSQPVIYGDAFFVFDGPPENPKRTLWNTAIVGAGTALVTTEAISFPGNTSLSPEYPGVDNLALSTIITHERMTRSQAVSGFISSRNKDRLYVRKQSIVRNYNSVYLNTPGTLMRAAAVPQTGGTGSEGPTDGELIAEVVRAKHRRSPMGWALVQRDTLPPQTVGLAFTQDGNSPPNTIAAPSGSLALTSQWDVDGVLTPYASTTYAAAEMTFSSSPPVAFNAIFPTTPSGLGAVYLGAMSSFYPAKTPTASADPPTYRYVTPTRSWRFELSVTNQLHVANALDAVQATGILPVTAPQAQLNLMTGEWLFPAKATAAQFRDEARSTIRLQLYNLNGMMARVISPPVASFSVAIYYYALDRVLYAILNNKTFGGLVAFSNARTAYFTALVSDPGAADDALAALLALVTVVHNDGLPLSFLSLSTPIGAAVVIG